MNGESTLARRGSTAMSTQSASIGRGDGILTSDEIAGLRLFIGKANCTQCHNGPLLTNNEFHNTGVPRRTGTAQRRRASDGCVDGAEGRIQLPKPLE